MGFLKCSSIFPPSLRFFSQSRLATSMKYLNVAEKNDAAKNIAALLSRGNSNRREGLSTYNKIYEFDGTLFGQNVQMVMTSVSGHLLNYEFASNYKNWRSCNPVLLFDAPVIKSCHEDYQKIKKTLEREIRTCGGLIIWTDCDREGENIGFEIIKVCTDIKPNLIVYRAKFSEITAASIFRALNNLGQPNKNVSDAVDVRQELDLRTGAAFTRLQTLRLQKVFPQKLSDKLISYGSCQFPTLGFVVERYLAIEDFVPENFWSIKMNHKIKDLVVDFNWKRYRLFNKTAVENLLDICQETPTATVEQVESKPKSKWRPLPLDTVELEKTVSKKLRINAKDTMKIAEKLYTQGYISYPRTETNIFPKELNLVPLIEQQTQDNHWGPFAQRILGEGGPNPRQGRKSDQAHPPIHPIKHANNLGGNDQRVYEYIVRHFLACVSKDALGHETVVHVDIANEKFSAKGLFILERNYLEVYIYDKWNAKEIHEYQNGDTFLPTELTLSEGTTSPPKLLTEADLIALMDKHGIGTDATHAEHIDTIKSREYVGLHENLYFVPGTLGMGLVEGYNNMGLNISLAKPDLRAQFERDLQLICDGHKSVDVVRREQIEKYKAVFLTVMENMNAIDRSLGNRLEDQPLEVPMDEVISNEEFKSVLRCPKCGRKMILRTRKDNANKFLSCEGFPDCKNAVWFPNSVENVEVLNENCSSCRPEVKMLKMKFRYNLFPGEPNPNILCIGGCDITVMETLNIKLESVRKTNINNTTLNTRNVQVIPNQATLNNWITGGNVSSSQNSRQNSTSRNTFQNNGNSNNRQYTTTSTAPRSFINSTIRVTDMNMGTSMMLPTPTTSTNNFNQFSNHDRSFSVDNNGVTNCHCNTEAVLFTVRKEGPNTGRQFHKCRLGSLNGGCDFFSWADDNVNPQATRINADSSNLPNCNCNIPAVLRVVTKAGPNNGKQFYCCSKPMGESCRFFQWKDDGRNNNQGGNRRDDDDDDDDHHHNPSQGNTSTWQGRSNYGNKKKKSQWKGKSKTKTKTLGQLPYNINGGTSGRKCSLCKNAGHTKKNCPNR